MGMLHITNLHLQPTLFFNPSAFSYLTFNSVFFSFLHSCSLLPFYLLFPSTKLTKFPPLGAHLQVVQPLLQRLQHPLHLLWR